MVAWCRSNACTTLYKHWVETIPEPHLGCPGVTQLHVKQNTKIELRQSLGLTYGNPVSLNCVHSATQTLVTHGTPEGAQMNVKRSTNTELRQSLGFSIASNTQYKHSWYLIVNLAESGGIESDNRARDLNLTIVFLVNRAAIESDSSLNRAALQSRRVWLTSTFPVPPPMPCGCSRMLHTHRDLNLTTDLNRAVLNKLKTQNHAQIRLWRWFWQSGSHFDSDIQNQIGHLGVNLTIGLLPKSGSRAQIGLHIWFWQPGSPVNLTHVNNQTLCPSPKQSGNRAHILILTIGLDGLILADRSGPDPTLFGCVSGTAFFFFFYI